MNARTTQSVRTGPARDANATPESKREAKRIRPPAQPSLQSIGSTTPATAPGLQPSAKRGQRALRKRDRDTPRAWALLASPTAEQAGRNARRVPRPRGATPAKRGTPDALNSSSLTPRAFTRRLSAFSASLSRLLPSVVPRNLVGCLGQGCSPPAADASGKRAAPEDNWAAPDADCAAPGRERDLPRELIEPDQLRASPPMRGGRFGALDRQPSPPPLGHRAAPQAVELTQVGAELGPDQPWAVPRLARTCSPLVLMFELSQEFGITAWGESPGPRRKPGPDTTPCQFAGTDVLVLPTELDQSTTQHLQLGREPQLQPFAELRIGLREGISRHRPCRLPLGGYQFRTVASSGSPESEVAAAEKFRGHRDHVGVPDRSRDPLWRLSDRSRRSTCRAALAAVQASPALSCCHYGSGHGGQGGRSWFPCTPQQHARHREGHEHDPSRWSSARDEIAAPAWPANAWFAISDSFSARVANARRKIGSGARLQALNSQSGWEDTRAAISAISNGSEDRGGPRSRTAPEGQAASAERRSFRLERSGDVAASRKIEPAAAAGVSRRAQRKGVLESPTPRGLWSDAARLGQQQTVNFKRAP
ncbi:hypothetical protein FQR65_LT21018 [Abscondita terminalis]|nr:hypothetical protein FQR65_LT21018 [Abscondita terminalis]